MCGGGGEMFPNAVYGLKNITSFFIILRSGLFPGTSPPSLPGVKGEKKIFEQMLLFSLTHNYYQLARAVRWWRCCSPRASEVRRSKRKRVPPRGTMAHCPVCVTQDSLCVTTAICIEFSFN